MQFERRSFVPLTNLYIKSLFPRNGCSISYSSIWIFSHFCSRAKEYTVYRNLENCFRWDDRDSNKFLPRVPSLLDSQTKQCKMWNKAKQNKATDVFTAALSIQGDSMARNAGQSMLKLPLY